MSNNLSVGPALIYEAVTPSNDPLPGGDCRALLVGVAGLANLTRLDGTIATGVPLIAGYNPLQCKAVRAGTAAGNIWAIYQ